MVAVLIVAGLAALAIWQVHRRAEKLDLIARVEARLRTQPVPAPGPDAWTGISAASDAYRRVSARGRWLPDRSVLVQAVTERGGGSWVMTPLAREDGTTILVNRGFIPTEERDAESWRPRILEPATVSGLLRITEPGGGFLRANDPAAGRWYSRDVAAIAASQRLQGVAPYFIDAGREPGDAGLPVGGLTVVAFPNNHLVYALTWGILAVMAAAGAAFVNLDRLRPGRFGSRHADMPGS
ncbi:MAG: SURF1 family protein [Microvirga sp.]